ncbi:hypothetical protein V5799_010557 [Amblyomma americanum]|uniref:Uncharacterized protein n=1 Tax=Amblyomma americanum TaxID=6943 RepID=A0AAQ4EJR1_AMBAM
MRHCYAAGPKKCAGAVSPAASCAMIPRQDSLASVCEDPPQQSPQKTSNQGRPDLLLSGMFRPLPDYRQPQDDDAEQPELTVTCPESRSAPFTLVLSSAYAVVLHVCFAASSWWLVQKYLAAGLRMQAGITLFLAQLSSLPLFLVGVCRLIGREQQPSSGCILLLVLHVLGAGLFNMVPLLQLVLRLLDSIVLYRTRGKQDQAALLKRQDTITFTNLMWVATLSCFPQAVFQAEQLFEAALQGQAYTLGSSWLQAANLSCALLLTGFACVKFNNRHAKTVFTWPTIQSALRTAAEQAAWLPLLAARVLAFAVLIAKALEPTHVFGIFFALSLHFEFRRDRASLLAGQPRGFLLSVAANVARATVGMFFKLRNWQEPLAAKPYIVFAIMLLVQSFGCVFLPFLQQYGFSMSMDAFRAYYAEPVFVACISVHYALLVLGTAFLLVWYRVEGAGTSGYGAI